MNMKRNLLWLAITSLALPAGHIYAQDEMGFEEEEALPPVYQNHIQLGVGNADGNGKFGEDAEDFAGDSTFPDASIKVSGGAEDGSHILYLNGVKNEYGSDGEAGYVRPGSFKIEVFGREHTHVEFGDALTLYPNAEGADLTALPDTIDTSDPANYGERDFEVERRSQGVSITQYFGKEWSLNLDYSREDKNGTKTAGAGQGFYGTQIIAEPVDYQHDQLTVGLEYATDMLSVGVSFYHSELDNANETVFFNNPNAAAGSHFAGTEQNALAPSNDFNRWDINGTFRLGDRTAINWLLNWSEAEQDEGFLPYSINDTAFFAPTSPLAAPNLDGQVNRFTGRITLTSRPTNSFNYKVEYAVRDQDSDHDPMLWDLLWYNGGVAPMGATQHVWDKDHETIKLEGGYRLANRSKIRFGWERDTIERTRKELDGITQELLKEDNETEEDTFWVGYRFAPIGGLTLNVKAETSSRDNDIDELRIEHLHSIVVIDVGGVPTLVAEGENTLPFFMSEVDTDRFTISADYPLSDSLVLSGSYYMTDEDFDADGFDGLKARESDTFNLALTWQPSKNLLLSVYAMQQDYEWEQDGTTSSGGGAVSAIWIADGDDETDMWGVNLDWQAMEQLSIKADLSWVESDSKESSLQTFTDVSDGLPTYGTEVTRLNLEADWELNAQTAISARYVYEDWESDDYTWNGEIIDSIGFGWEMPNEDGQALILGVKHRF